MSMFGSTNESRRPEQFLDMPLGLRILFGFFFSFTYHFGAGSGVAVDGEIISGCEHFLGVAMGKGIVEIIFLRVGRGDAVGRENIS